MSVVVRKNSIGSDEHESDREATGKQRVDSLAWAADDFVGIISHTPPTFSPGSLEMPMVKRNRSNSISGRLRSASDLEERGFIDRFQKGVLRDLIISGDQELHNALDKYENGDPVPLEALMDSGVFNRRSSLDLLEDLDFGFLNVGSLGNTPKDEYGVPDPTVEDLDELKFEHAFADMGSRDSIDPNSAHGHLSNSLPSVGMGITPPNPFLLVDDFLENKTAEKSEPLISSPSVIRQETPERTDRPQSSTTSRPIGIPGTSQSNQRDNHLAVREIKKCVGAYSPESRRKRIAKFVEKRKGRIWTKKVKYDVRKNFADSRLRLKGRFVKKEDEQLLRELLSMT